MAQDLTVKGLWSQDSNTVLTVKPFALSQVASDFVSRWVWMLQMNRIRRTVPSKCFGQCACRGWDHARYHAIQTLALSCISKS